MKTNAILTVLLLVLPNSAKLATCFNFPKKNLSFQPPFGPASPSAEQKQKQNDKITNTVENGIDPENYPHCFTGRLWFRPALVRIKPNDPIPPPESSVSLLHLFGWTIGGTVALEYDESPVGPYREYVTMGGLVVSKKSSGSGGGVVESLGQWGSRLYVSTKEAEQVCQDLWNVPAELADIDFYEEEEEDSESLESKSPRQLSVVTAPNQLLPTGTRQSIAVNGWGRTRILDEEEDLGQVKRYGGLPVLWTPSIKALWAPVRLLPLFWNDNSQNEHSKEEGDEQNKKTSLPLHRLRLSASAIRLTLCGQSPSDLLGIPIGIGLLVDNVLIEISRQNGEFL